MFIKNKNLEKTRNVRNVEWRRYFINAIIVIVSVIIVAATDWDAAYNDFIRGWNSI